MTQEVKRIDVQWEGDLLFRGGEAGRPAILMDGDNLKGPGPMVTLLLAAASCTGSDVVLILQKMRVRLQEFRIEVAGTRRESEPRRYVAVHLVYHLRGEGLDQARAERAVALSVEKYCSVIHSLAPDIAVTHAVQLGQP